MRGSNKCHHCGRFFSYKDFDEFTHFGSSEDLEPPDPMYLCIKCSITWEDRMVKDGRVYTPWRPGRCHRNAAKRLGWKMSGPRGAEWGEYRDPKKSLPKDYEWRE